MNKKSFHYLLLLVFLLQPMSGFAQNMFEEVSAFGLAGLGLINDFRGSDGEALGIKGVSLLTPFSANIANPALLGTVVTTSGSSGVRMTNLYSQEGQASAWNTTLVVDHFQVMFPLIKGRLGFALSLIPNTKRGFNATRNDQRAVDDQNIAFNVNEIGKGGLNTMELSLGYRINDALYVGYGTGLLFGTLNTERTIDFAVVTLRDTRLVSADNYLGWSNRFGALFRFGKMKKKQYKYTLGATLNLPVRLRVHRELENQFLSLQSNTALGATAVSTTRLPNESALYPWNATLGLSYQISPQFQAHTEYDFQSWGNFNNFEVQSTVNFKDRHRLGMGIEFSPANRFNRNFLRRLKYRAGVAYETGFFSILNEDVQSLIGSAGFSIPSPASGSSIDFNVLYGRRGLNTGGLVTEDILTFRLAFNLSEIMFFKRLIQ